MKQKDTFYKWYFSEYGTKQYFRKLMQILILSGFCCSSLACLGSKGLLTFFMLIVTFLI